MSFLRTHMALMFIYAAATGLFFTLLSKYDQPQRERVKFFLVVFGSLFLGGIVLGWLMFPFPLK